MLLILSARTVGEDIALQFGRLPPSFLPMGDRRLYALQLELARGGPCFMTVPEDYAIPDIDTRALAEAGVTLLAQPQSLSLTGAIADALSRIPADGPLRILYGDTLVRMDDAALNAPDTVAVHSTTANYTWAYVKEGADGGTVFSDEPPSRLDTRRVVCGYYNFADPALLAEACQGRSIVAALQHYNDARPLACVDAGDWLDFGHLALYFRSKRDVQVSRVFNELVYDNELLLKRSADTAKMRAEAHWFESLPDALRLHVPRYAGRVERDFQAGYALEYLYAPLLSDLSVFGDLPLASWLEIIEACFGLLGKFHGVRPPDGAPEGSPAFADAFFQDMIVGKTHARLETFAAQSGIDLDTAITVNGVACPPLSRVADDLIARVPATTPDHMRLWHGDLFFGNMFYDVTARRVLAIDPRGQLSSGQLCLYGDLRYDIAKLAHSIIGQYDKILLGRSTLTGTARDWTFSIEEQPHQRSIEGIFRTFVAENYGLGQDELIAMTALLFLSMLPLHDDHPERQRHLLANGLKLWATIGAGA